GHIPVPRENPRAALRTLALAADTIRQRGISLLVFPEGGRSHDGALSEFKEGAAYIAIKAQVPIVPITLTGTRKILPFGSAVFSPGRVRLQIGEPLPTRGLTLRERGPLTEKTRAAIVRMLENEPFSETHVTESPRLPSSPPATN
ncbi:MAG: lysophospholipid acyltransferase family protein, partial [Pseudomonadota bacterium]